MYNRIYHGCHEVAATEDFLINANARKSYFRRLSGTLHGTASAQVVAKFWVNSEFRYAVEQHTRRVSESRLTTWKISPQEILPRERRKGSYPFLCSLKSANMHAYELICYLGKFSCNTHNLV